MRELLRLNDTEKGNDKKKKRKSVKWAMRKINRKIITTRSGIALTCFCDLLH